MQRLLQGSLMIESPVRRSNLNIQHSSRCSNALNNPLIVNEPLTNDIIIVCVPSASVND